MKTIAEFAIRRRWFVVVGWIVLIVAVQAIASAMGGAAYKDTFSLPHTETASVAKLLKNAGLDNQNGVTGTVVLKNKSNEAFDAAPAQLQPALVKLCTSGNYVAMVSTPWFSVDCSKDGAVGPGNPKLLNTARGSNTALVNITWQSDHYDQTLFKNVYDSLKSLNSSTLQAEFTGNAFAGIGQSQGSGGSVFIGFLAALIILALVFRTVAATVLPLASAAVALVGGLGVIYILSHVINVSNIT
ncbi:MAG TPA: MMPL family transporter, partial [Jatrophihabitantaceae bacterium]